MDGSDGVMAGGATVTTGGEAAPAAAAVRRRHVFYVSGFDPQGPAHYHRLYADEGPRQAAVSGYSLSVGRRERTGPSSSTWAVEGRFDGHAASVAARVEFLRWDDIVRAHWPRSRWQVMLGALASTARQVANGALWRVLKTSWPAFVVLAAPPLLVVTLVVWAAATAVAVAGAWGSGRWLAGLVGLAASGGAWYAFAGWAEAKVQMAWLMRSTRFILQQAVGRAPDLEARLDEFGARIAEVWAAGEADEVLVVGHSSGAMLAVSAVARALVAGAAPSGRAPLSLLTLGECIPMLSYQPEAAAFRDELARLATRRDVEWLDVTAPPDGCCFALVDPTAPARAAFPSVPPGWQPPKRLSARFAQMFPAEEYRCIRRDKYRCHFQYLMASGKPVDYDYFAITAGPLRLRDRFRAHPSVEDFRQFQMFGGPGS
jgi:hypothetical protein